MTPTATNWAGNRTYRAACIHHPATIDELRATVARASSIHALGARHSFNGIADAGVLVTLDRLAPDIVIDRDAATVTVNGGTSYGTLAGALHREGLALHTMASLPHITVAGAIATATHGSGDASGNLATAVAALELVTSNGELVRVTRGDPDFAGMVVGLGALGVVTRVTLDVQPGYMMRQQVFEHLPWDTLDDHFDEIMASAGSVSLFTDYGEDVHQVWCKNRVHPGAAGPLPDTFFGARAATAPRHPLPAQSGAGCTAQLGVPGPWHERLPHFRAGAVPSSGAEIQSEYLVPRRHAIPALHALRGVADAMRPHLLVSEMRTIAADDLWLSMTYGRDSVGFHFTWQPDQAALLRVLPQVEAALAPFEARPHWGKLFTVTAGELASHYERLPDFRRLAARLDPRGAFRNDFLERHVLG